MNNNNNKPITLDGYYVIPFKTPQEEIDYINITSDQMGLYDFEISRMAAEIRDFKIVELDHRQAATLLKCYLSFLKPRLKDDIPWRNDVSHEHKWFINYYHHIDCETQPNIEWQDEGDSMCNDHCPACDKEIEPYKSEEI